MVIEMVYDTRFAIRIIRVPFPLKNKFQVPTLLLLKNEDSSPVRVKKIRIRYSYINIFICAALNPRDQSQVLIPWIQSCFKNIYPKV